MDCYYCAKSIAMPETGKASKPMKTRAIGVYHDKRGCRPVCPEHWAWRYTCSSLVGHAPGCPRPDQTPQQPRRRGAMTTTGPAPGPTEVHFARAAVPGGAQAGILCGDKAAALLARSRELVTCPNCRALIEKRRTVEAFIKGARSW